MNSIRWLITDRKTGKVHTVPHPANKQEREEFQQILHNVL